MRRMRQTWLAVVTGLLVAPSVHAAIHTEFIEYEHDGTQLMGYLAYDEAIEGKRPGVVVVHEWKGFGAYAKRRAEQLAGLGYVAFAIDMYGKGVFASDHREAKQLSGLYVENRGLMRARAHAGLQVLRDHPLTDAVRLGAIGYCFGGGTVLEMSRAGEPLVGVVSFHGMLSNPHPGDAAHIRGKVLVLHGADDGYVSAEAIAALKSEMDAVGIDYRLIEYPGAVHSFTVQEAGDDPTTGRAYHAEADRQSWAEMKAFFAEAFDSCTHGQS